MANEIGNQNQNDTRASPTSPNKPNFPLPPSFPHSFEERNNILDLTLGTIMLCQRPQGFLEPHAHIIHQNFARADGRLS